MILHTSMKAKYGRSIFYHKNSESKRKIFTDRDNLFPTALQTSQLPFPYCPLSLQSDICLLLTEIHPWFS